MKKKVIKTKSFSTKRVLWLAQCLIASPLLLPLIFITSLGEELLNVWDKYHKWFFRSSRKKTQIAPE